MKLLILGATGLVGRNVLAQALSHPSTSLVVAPTRSPLPAHPKLINPVSGRLESVLANSDMRGVDSVVCALGTTIKKAGSKEAFRQVDYALPLEFAKWAHQNGTETFVLVSASVASVGSRFFYPRVKGEVERDVSLVGFKSLTIVRPSLIGGQREERRAGEHFALLMVRLLAPFLPKKYRLNPATSIAAACMEAAVTANPGLHFVEPASLA